VIILKLIFSYFIGSIPTGYLAGKLLKGLDIREHGSGNVGATNVFRVVGKIPGFAVLLLDIFKGYLAVSLIASGEGALYRLLIGLTAIAGHNWTLWLKFKGGKGVAVSAGVIIALAPKVFVFSLLVWVVLFLITRYVSVSSIGAALVMPVLAMVFGKDPAFIIFTVILAISICYTHRSNIKRLQKGEEKKI